MNEFHVCMVGPSKVGKTSLLAAISAEMNPFARNLELNFAEDDAHGPDAGALDDARQKLRKLAANDNFIVQDPELIDGNTGYREFRFDIHDLSGDDGNLGHIGKFIFTDLPGKWYGSSTRLLKKSSKNLNTVFWRGI